MPKHPLPLFPLLVLVGFRRSAPTTPGSTSPAASRCSKTSARRTVLPAAVRTRRVERQPITPEDVVFFGSLRVPATRLLAGGEARGEAPRSTVSLSGSMLTLGRDPECDMALDDPRVSTRHATLRRSGEHWVLTDLGSTNGTFVNGGRVAGPMTVSVGDVIGLGSYTLRGQFRQSIGYVPQDDIMHRELTVRQALYYNARLRLSGELTNREIHQRIGIVYAACELRGDGPPCSASWC